MNSDSYRKWKKLNPIVIWGEESSKFFPHQPMSPLCLCGRQNELIRMKKAKKAKKIEIQIVVWSKETSKFFLHQPMSPLCLCGQRN